MFMQPVVALRTDCIHRNAMTATWWNRLVWPLISHQHPAQIILQIYIAPFQQTAMDQTGKLGHSLFNGYVHCKKFAPDHKRPEAV